MIHWHIHELIKEFTFTGAEVIEFGDQEVNINEGWRSEAKGEYLDTRSFYTTLHITSIDITGEHGALNLDLSKNIPTKDRPKPGDVLTDFGTLEHVESLYYGLKNAFNLIKTGGIAIHVNPLSKGYVANHGFHYFTEGFWKAYAEAAKMELVEVPNFNHPSSGYKDGFLRFAAYHNIDTGWELVAVYKKTKGSKFPTKAAFDKIYNKHIKKS